MSGLTPQERDIMALRDQGCTVCTIALRLGLPAATVSRCVRYYEVRGDEERVYRHAMEASNRVFLNALRREARRG